jgi:hypothetical protein
LDIIGELEDLRKLNDYSFALLKETEGKLQTKIYGRNAYLHGLIVLAIAQVQGIVCLVDNKQYRVSVNLVRSLYEIWVTARFIYCSKSFVYARVLVHISEQERLKKLETLSADGHVSQEDLDSHQKRIRDIEKFMKRTYPKWPDVIPDVIRSGTPVMRKRVNLKQSCQIIDFYDAKYHRTSEKSVTMVMHYERMYGYLSGVPHADPVALGNAFTNRAGEVVHIDIDGSSDSDETARLIAVAFAFQYELISKVKQHIYGERVPKMSDEIESIARAKGVIR